MYLKVQGGAFSFQTVYSIHAVFLSSIKDYSFLRLHRTLLISAFSISSGSRLRSGIKWIRHGAEKQSTKRTHVRQTQIYYKVQVLNAFLRRHEFCGSVCRFVVNEMVQSEKDYVKDLGVIVEVRHKHHTERKDLLTLHPKDSTNVNLNVRHVLCWRFSGLHVPAGGQRDSRGDERKRQDCLRQYPADLRLAPRVRATNAHVNKHTSLYTQRCSLGVFLFQLLPGGVRALYSESWPARRPLHQTCEFYKQNDLFKTEYIAWLWPETSGTQRRTHLSWLWASFRTRFRAQFIYFCLKI